MKSLNKPNPVLLVHGIFDTMRIFDKMSRYLKKLGWEVYSLNLVPNYGILGLDKLAEQVANYVDKIFPPNQPFDLIGFSMGGIVSRYYVQRLGGIERVERFITISSPHNGTLTGYALNLAAPTQMRPKSAFLEDLNQDIALLEQINFTSIWTPYDAMILPARSSQIPVGKDIKINVLLHAWMVSDEKVLKLIVEELKVDPKSKLNLNFIR
ncbi:MULTISPECIES: triacylglycerol lipase [Okeania]|uniref:Triacylglycerol lipase n=2 Tax=Okeania TaxID=1458928 RepID=A0A3N6NN59_9CYAN|nr:MULTISPECIES: triacylglycerol lipase [Okeania]NEP40047.1 triacylglycerol lipase [Okeania sp. SIO2H7]NET12580.1 triacylglycerol lipase [Okeania sp. SIO1H6]NEP74998.1 triacylglycerol lipase [Okeania sp. SIO2G5]NEP94526.1 triacylglycerol lipase [Okeania sp. SIO2F5]NEQ92852.1 triacylglycerol lipase [Okeania sp. SIO2G4]